MGFSKGIKNEFETAVVNEPPLPLRFTVRTIYTRISIQTTVVSFNQVSPESQNYRTYKTKQKFESYFIFFLARLRQAFIKCRLCNHKMPTEHEVGEILIRFGENVRYVTLII